MSKEYQPIRGDDGMIKGGGFGYPPKKDFRADAEAITGTGSIGGAEGKVGPKPRWWHGLGSRLKARWRRR